MKGEIMAKLYSVILSRDVMNTVRNALSLAVNVSKSIPHNKRATEYYTMVKEYFDMEYEKQNNEQ